MDTSPLESNSKEKRVAGQTCPGCNPERLQKEEERGWKLMRERALAGQAGVGLLIGRCKTRELASNPSPELSQGRKERVSIHISVPYSFFFLNTFFIYLFLNIYLFTFGCVGS